MLNDPQTKLQDGMWKKSVHALRPSGSTSGLSRSKNVDFIVTPQMNGSLLSKSHKTVSHTSTTNSFTSLNQEGVRNLPTFYSKLPSEHLTLTLQKNSTV